MGAALRISPFVFAVAPTASSSSPLRLLELRQLDPDHQRRHLDDAPCLGRDHHGLVGEVQEGPSAVQRRADLLDRELDVHGLGRVAVVEAEEEHQGDPAQH